jgi:hypothetical protein
MRDDWLCAGCGAVALTAIIVAMVDYYVVQPWRERKENRRALELQQEVEARRATCPVPINHDHETQLESSGPPAAASTTEMPIIPEQKFHSGPKNDHDF